jgi:hypothetical protein
MNENNAPAANGGSHRSGATIVALIGAAGVVVAAIISAVALLISSGGDSVSPPPRQANSTPPSTTSVPTTPPSSSTTSSPSATPLRSGPVTLSEGYSADLDSDLPNWNVGQGCGGNCDLWLQDGLRPGYGGEIAPISSTESPSVDTCAGATAYEPSIDERRLIKGFRICIKTTEDNFALAEIVKVITSADGELAQLRFDITVWSRPQ